RDRRVPQHRRPRGPHGLAHGRAPLRPAAPGRADTARTRRACRRRRHGVRPTGGPRRARRRAARTRGGRRRARGTAGRRRGGPPAPRGPVGRCRRRVPARRGGGPDGRRAASPRAPPRRPAVAHRGGRSGAWVGRWSGGLRSRVWAVWHAHPWGVRSVAGHRAGGTGPYLGRDTAMNTTAAKPVRLIELMLNIVVEFMDVSSCSYSQGVSYKLVD